MKRIDCNTGWTVQCTTRNTPAVPVTLPHDAMLTEPRTAENTLSRLNGKRATAMTSPVRSAASNTTRMKNALSDSRNASTAERPTAAASKRRIFIAAGNGTT